MTEPAGEFGGLAAEQRRRTKQVGNEEDIGRSLRPWGTDIEQGLLHGLGAAGSVLFLGRG